MRCGRIRIQRDPSEPILRVSDDILKCVGYVYQQTHKDATGVYGDVWATGFFVSLPCVSPELKEHHRMHYFVTAKHVITDLQHGDIFLTANKKTGGTTSDFSVPEQRFWTHPTDNNADVAVVQIGIDPTADIISVAVEDFGLPDRLEQWNIGIGDDVHAVGLFSAIPGNNSNTPIVRFGNIAMMPPEQIQTDLGYTDAYLIEARSIGGMSGSPVFVRRTIKQEVTTTGGKSLTVFYSGAGETLFGMAQSHWDIREEDINKPSFVHDRKRGVNYGIAVVVPARKIYETLYSPALIEMRKAQEQQILRRTVPGSDSARPKDKTPPFTKVDFDAALKKVSRKIEAKKN
jgi:hypothetical protein